MQRLFCSLIFEVLKHLVKALYNLGLGGRMCIVHSIVYAFNVLAVFIAWYIKFNVNTHSDLDRMLVCSV